MCCKFLKIAAHLLCLLMYKEICEEIPGEDVYIVACLMPVVWYIHSIYIQNASRPILCFCIVFCRIVYVNNYVRL